MKKPLTCISRCFPTSRLLCYIGLLYFIQSGLSGISPEQDDAVKELLREEKTDEGLKENAVPFKGKFTDFKSGCLILIAKDNFRINCHALFVIRLEANGTANGVIDGPIEIVGAQWQKEKNGIRVKAQVQEYCSILAQIITKDHKDYESSKECLRRRRKRGQYEIQIQIKELSTKVWGYRLSTEEEWHKCKALLSPYVDNRLIP